MQNMLSPIEAYISKHLRFNFAIGLMDGGFFGLGMGFASFSAIIPLFVHHLTESTVLALTFVMLIWQGLGAGLAANPWTSMVSKVIPRDLLGTFFGAQSAAFNGLAGVASIFAGIILDKIAAPWNFSLCFAL